MFVLAEKLTQAGQVILETISKSVIVEAKSGSLFLVQLNHLL